MTGRNSENKHKKDTKGQKKRNKTMDASGRKYDTRKGSWGGLNKAIIEEGRLLDSWLTPLRIQIELSLLNFDGKPGRKYLYPPSLIIYISLLKEDDDRSYRRAISKIQTLLGLSGLPIPTYTTLFKSQAKF